MARHGGRGRRTALQHVLDEIDAPARPVELVAGQEISGTGGEAEAAMDAGPEDLLGLRHIGIGELGQSEIGLHETAQIP